MKIGEKKEMICIVCPIGCRMMLECMKEDKAEDAYSITGNKCRRGFDYAVKEITSPIRMLTTTVKIEMGILKRLPVRTQNPIPKELIFDCMEVINNIKVYAPISMGDVVIRNILATGVDVIATRSMDQSK